MKKFLIALSMIFIVCATFAQTSPCDDPKFLDLKKKGVANLTETEMSYYAQKEKECDQFTKSQNVDNTIAISNAENAIQRKHQSQRAESGRKVRRKISTWFWISVFGAAVYFAYQHDMGK